ncbi:MAG: HIT domain-containing protein [Candidatus Pacearchaeota archaeon]
MLTEEISKEIKEKLISQLKNFPEDKRELMKEKILSLSTEELENFLKENKLIATEPKEKECIFCSIANKKIPSFIIGEDSENLAALEINPVVKAHTLVIPKNHGDETEIPDSTFSLAKKIAKKIKEVYKPKEIKIISKKVFEHSAIEVIPLFEGDKGKIEVTEEELKKIQKELKIEEKKEEGTKTQLPVLEARRP